MATRLGSTAHEHPVGTFTSAVGPERGHGQLPEPTDAEHRGTDAKALDHIEHLERLEALQSSSPRSAKRSTSRASVTATTRSRASPVRATPRSTGASPKAASPFGRPSARTSAPAEVHAAATDRREGRTRSQSNY